MLDITQKFTFIGDGLTGTVVKNTTTSFDYKVTTENTYLSGAELIWDSATFGDYVQFEIIDIDNVLGYGENVVLAEYIKKWYISPDSNCKKVMSPYAGLIPVNTYIRVKYTNTSVNTDQLIAVNIYLHKIR